MTGLGDSAHFPVEQAKAGPYQPVRQAAPGLSRVAEFIGQQRRRFEVKPARGVLAHDRQGIGRKFIGEKGVQEHAGIHDHALCSNSRREAR